MTIYTTSNRSIEFVDPLKQPGQTLPAYSVEPEAQENIASNEKSQPVNSTMAQRFHKMSAMAARPLNKAANVIGAEGWWPTDLERECNKAGRILHSFTGLSSSVLSPKSNGPMHPAGLTRKSMVKIPPAVLQRAAGLAIFNVFRAGAGHGSLAAGSGVVISRHPDGTWSPPSAFVVTTLGAGFVFGLDVYDCVCVLNTPEQVNAFTRPRVSLGAEGSISVGPIGTGSSVEAAMSKTVKPMWTYMKSRGLCVGIQIEGTIIVSRGDANATFYNKRGITARQILCDEVAWPMGAKPLFEVLRALQGHADYERGVVSDLASVPTSGKTVEHETYADAPRAQNEEEQSDVEVASEESALPAYEDVKQGNKEDDYEMVLDEKERLAKSGY